MDKIKIIIDDAICDDYVYEVTIKIEANKSESYYQTTFSKRQPEVGINRAIKASKIEKHHIKKVIITKIQQLGNSQ